MILILSDSQYKGWQPEKDDLLDIQMGQLYFVDRYGRLSLKEARWLEEEGTDSHSSTSFENTPLPQLVPSMKRSTSGPSSIYPSAESPESIGEVTAIRSGSNATAVDEVTRLASPKPEPAPGQSNDGESLESGRLAAAQPGPTPGKSGGLGGPPPPDGRFFNNPLNLRTIMTGTGDGYRSPEPVSRLGTLSPLHHLHKDRPILGGGSLGMATERPRPSFSAPQAIATQPPNGPGFGAEYGHGLPPPLSTSSVLPPELTAYNDLMMDIGTAQYLGTEVREPGPPPFVYPPVPTNDGGSASDSGLSINGYQRQGVSYHVVHGSPQTMPSFGYHQQGQPYRGVDHISAQQMDTNCGAQWPTGGITDYR